jgi:hypothetical protein
MKNSLNNIRLTPRMLADLYGQSLVAPIDHTAVRKTAPVPIVVPKFLGGNAKRITVLVRHHESAFLPENELAFLTKMLDACRLNIGDVSIVNLATQPIAPEEAATALQAEKTLCFGLKSDAPLFSLTQLSGKPAIYAPAIEQMVSETADARALKSKLWTALKQMFGL